MTTSDVSVCQRWNKKRESYRPAGEPIDVNRYGVELLTEAQAREFLTTHHYAGGESYPATQLRLGLFRSTGYTAPELVGAMVFGVPTHNSTFAKWVPGVTKDDGTVLQRLALLDEVPANGETWFLGRAFEALEAELPSVKVVLSYSDPVARVNAQGVEYKPGHIGTIYKAHNGVYLGRTPRDDTYLYPDGEVIAPRSMSKLRNSERGGRALEKRLLARGAPARLEGESDRDYAYRLVREDLFIRRRRRPGNHVYAWAVASERRARKSILSQFNPKPRPTEPDAFVLGPVEFERRMAA